MEKKFLLELSGRLFKCIDVATDSVLLLELGEIGMQLEPRLELEDLSGLGRGFFLWAGLKVDQPSMGSQYKLKIVATYPELAALLDG